MTLNILVILGIIASGASAYMQAEGFEGNYLYCDGKMPEHPHGTLTYTLDAEWAVMPIRWYEDGRVS